MIGLDGTLAPRIVLDTNAVLDWIVFEDPRVKALADAIDAGRVQPVTSLACLEELRRALGYRALRLDAEAQRLALERYVARVEMLELPAPAPPARLPVCADPDDQKFLELAWYAGADCLLTRDHALLDLAARVRKLGPLRILTPDAGWDLPSPDV